MPTDHRNHPYRDLYTGPKRNERIDPLAEKLKLSDRFGNLTLSGTLGTISITFAAGFLLTLGLPYLLTGIMLAAMLALPVWFLYCVVGAVWGFAKQRWHRH